MTQNAFLPLGLAAAVFFAGAPAQADPMLEARVSKLERLLSDQRQSDLLLQIQQLQQEVQELRGMVEEQQFRLYRQGRATSDDSAESSPGREAGAYQSRPALPSWPRPTTPDPFPPTPDYRQDPFGLDAGPAGTQTDIDTNQALLPALPSPETTSGSEREAYREAFEYLKARDYDAARNAFGEMVKRYPRGEFADNSRYWLGEISYQSNDYPAARAAFEELIQQYPSSPKVPGAMLKLGYLACDQGDTDQCRVIMQAVVRRFPDSAEGRLAARRLSEMNSNPPPAG